MDRLTVKQTTLRYLLKIKYLKRYKRLFHTPAVRYENICSESEHIQFNLIFFYSIEREVRILQNRQLFSQGVSKSDDRNSSVGFFRKTLIFMGIIFYFFISSVKLLRKTNGTLSWWKCIPSSGEVIREFYFSAFETENTRIGFSDNKIIIKCVWQNGPSPQQKRHPS